MTPEERDEETRSLIEALERYAWGDATWWDEGALETTNRRRMAASEALAGRAATWLREVGE